MEQYANEGRLANQTEGKEIRNGCLVYSVGSNGDFRFEEGFQKRLPGACEIHTFDFTNYAGRVPPGKNIFFHHWGLKPSYNETRNYKLSRFPQNIPPNKPFKTFQETVKELGHEGRPIDVFKIDCEGCEWSTYKDWIGADLRQILVEVHMVPAIAQDFFSDLQKAGYVTYVSLLSWLVLRTWYLHGMMYISTTNRSFLVSCFSFALFLQHKEPNIEYGGGECVEYGMLKLSTEFVEDRLATKQ